MKRGRAKTMTHDYKRNGTVDLFAALNVATGEVLHQTRKSHTASDVLSFFKWIDLHTPQPLEVHVVLDNLSAHTAPPVAAWLAHPKRDRWHLHFTPTSASWLNLVEGWFAQLTNRRLKHGTFTNVDGLVDAIDVWTSTLERRPQGVRLAQARTQDHRQRAPRSCRAGPPSQMSDAPLGRPPKSHRQACGCRASSAPSFAVRASMRWRERLCGSRLPLLAASAGASEASSHKSRSKTLFARGAVPGRAQRTRSPQRKPSNST